MSLSQIYATYLLYNMIFTEQQLDQDHFGATEQSEIANIALISFLVLDSFISTQQNIMKTQTDIRARFPAPLLTVSLDTLQDIIALDNNISSHLSQEFPIYTTLGQHYYQQNEVFFPKNTFSPKNEEEFFSTTMFFYESIMLLSANDYNLQESIQELKGHDYEQEISAILKYIKP